MFFTKILFFNEYHKFTTSMMHGKGVTALRVNGVSLYLVSELASPANRDWILQLLRNSDDDIVFDASYVDKLILHNPGVVANLMREHNTDDNTIFGSLRTLKMLRNHRETKIISSVKAAAPELRRKQVRVHYTNILHEPVLHHMMSMWTVLARKARPTSESVKYVIDHVGTSARFTRLMMAFLDAVDVVLHLNTAFAAGIVYDAGKMHKVKKALHKLPATLRMLVRKHAQNQLVLCAVKYEAALRDADYRVVTQMWKAGFRVLRDTYAIARATTYVSNKSHGNTVVIDNDNVLHALKTIVHHFHGKTEKQ